MSQVINTNIMSLNAQRNLSNSSGALATSLNRLSSGLRINSSKDDAAGLAISDRLTTQIRGLGQAVRNANDGISFAQTAEGALASVSTALQRIRELSIQAANDTNSASDRQALNNEVKQLVQEIGRVANSTEFNGERVLDGSVRDLFFQVGANQGQNIAVSGVDARNEQLGNSVIESEGGISQDDIKSLSDGIASIVGNITITVRGSAAPLTVSIAGARTLDDVVRSINAEIKEAAATDPDVRDAGLSAALIVDNEGNAKVTVRGAFDDNDPAPLFTVEGGEVNLNDTAATVVSLFDAGGAAQDSIKRSLIEVDVTTRFGAAQAIAVVDGALTQVSGLRAELGAVQVRFESTISNLGVSVENLTASRSRIMDADFAKETAELTRAQILQQAGVAMLAQANAIPQNVLSLLRG